MGIGAAAAQDRDAGGETTDGGPGDGLASRGESVEGGDVDAASRGRDRLIVCIALVPLLASAVALVVDVGGSFHPTGDLATSELAVRDIGHHPVLYGLYSRADWSHPGPMLWYLLWPLYRLTGSTGIGLALGALAINGAAVVGIAHIARRRGGTPLLVCSLLGCALLVRSLGAGFTASYWNLHITTLPFVLLVFLVWSLACGDRWALPATAIVATFLAQTHVGFVPVALGLAAWGVAGLTMAARRSPRPARAEARRAARPTAAMAGLLAVLWLPPAIDIAANTPSNARRILRWFTEADEPTHPIAEGWRVVSAQFGLSPEWLTGKQPSLFGLAESPYRLSAPAPVLLVAAVVAAWALWRWSPTSGRYLVTTLVVTLVVSVVAVARTVGPVFDYRLRWTWVPPTIAFVAVAWAGWMAIERRWRSQAQQVALPVLVAALVLVSGVDALAAATAGAPEHEDSEIMAALTPPVLDELDRLGISPEDEVAISDPYGAAAWFTSGLVVQLDRHGYDVRQSRGHRWKLGDHWVTDGDPTVHLVVVSDRSALRTLDRPGAHLLTTWSTIPTEDDGLAELAAAFDDIDQVHRDYAGGRIEPAGYRERLAAIDRAVPPRGDMAMRLVAVFRVDSSSHDS